MTTFNVMEWLASDAAAAAEAAVTSSRPEEVTCWTKTSRDAGGQFLFGDRSGLPTYAPPAALPLDLNTGFPDAYTAKQEADPSPVDTIVAAAAAAGGAAADWRAIGVVTYRNNLNKLLGTPLSLSEGWALHAAYLSGPQLLALDIVAGPPATYPNADLMQYYGYHFESVCTGGGGHVDATSEFASVVRFRLGQHQVLMAAEVDAQIVGRPPSAQQQQQQQQQQPGAPNGQPGEQQQQQQRHHYAELKTYTVPRHHRAVSTLYGVKHPRWWVQSFLAGIPTLVLGGRTPDGKLVKVHEVPVQLLPGLSVDAGQPWRPRLLLAFGDALLAWLKEQAAQHPDQQLRATFDPSSGCVRLEPVEGDLAQRLLALLS